MKQDKNPLSRCTSILLASIIALTSLANAGIIVTRGHIVGGSATGTLVAIDTPFISNANGTTATIGGPSWTTGGTIFANQADQGFAALSTASGVREFDSGGTPWEPDGTPFSQAAGYYIYSNGSPATTWTFNLASSGINLPDGTIIHGVYARFGGRNNDKARYEFTEGAASGNLLVDQNSIASAGDLGLRWFDSDGNPRDSNFQRIFNGPITVIGGDGFQLKISDTTSGNAGHIDAIVLDTSLPKANDVPAISTVFPVDNKTSVVPWTSLEITFDEPMALTGTGTVTITDLTDGSSTRVINLPNPQVTSPNGDDLLITPSSRLELGTQYSVKISANALVDLAPVPNAFPGILNDTTWNFTTRPVPDTLHNVLIVTAALADAQPSATAAQATNLMFHDPRNVDEAMRAASYQRIGLNLGDNSGLPTTVSLVYPETVAQQKTAGGSTNLRSRMFTSLTALGYNLNISNFRFILYIQPAALNTGNDGWANLYSNTSVYLAAPFNLRLAMHEMGHCMGGNHSQNGDLGCSLGGADVDYNASKKILFGWLNTPAGNVLTLPANTGTSQTLVPLSRDPDVMPGMRAIRVPNPNGGTATYLVSYRVNDGLYNTLQSSSFDRKVQVIEDAGGSLTTHRATLGAGQDYVVGKLKITCNSVATDGLSAAVTIGVGNPTLVSIADNVSGGPVTVGQPVNFTVTFDEAINPATISTADFENGSTAGTTVNSVSATANPAVFTVAVTTTTPGNLNLRIKAGAVIEDLDASPLNTTSPLPDNTTIAVNALAGPSLLSIADNVSGGPVAVGVPVNFTVTFNEAINAATLSTDDFENGSSAGITVDSVTATGNPAVFTVAVTTTSAGALTLQIKAGAVIEDLDSFALITSSALPDNTTISVKSTSAPILLSIADNVPGGSVVEGAPVTYTVTFDEAINATTIGTNDFENASTADITVNSVTATANPAVFTVAVTTTFRGDLNLRIKAAAVIEDLAGLALDTVSPLTDDTVITVTASPPPALLSITDNVSGGPVTSGNPVIYTVTFDKAINAASIGTGDFENGSSAVITLNNVSATANPAVFTLTVTPTTSGNLNIRIKAGAVVEDLYGQPLNTLSALPDNTTITVNAAPAVLYWDDNSDVAGFGTAGAGTGTWSAPTAGPTAGWSLSNTGANAFAPSNTGTIDTLNFGLGATGLGAGTITVSGTVNSGNMTFASGSGTIVLSGGTINLAPATTITVDNATNTIGSVLTGAATGLTKAGTGTLVLSNTNSYAGTTAVNAGTLVLSNANTLSGSTSVAATGTLQLGHANSMGTSTMTLASGATLQLRNDANTTFTAPIATPAGAVTYNFDVNQATGAGTARTLTRGNITFATSTANTINVTGGNSYTLGLGTLSSPSGTGGPWAFTVNATTAAVTITSFSAGSFGNALVLQGGNAITLSNFEMGSNSTNSLTVSGSGTVATLGSTTQTNNRAGGSVAYTLASGTLNLTTTSSLANVRAASGSLTAPTFAINGGTLNNTSGAALTLAASPATGTIAGSPVITLGGNFSFGTSASTSANNLNLGTGAITNGGNRTITFAGTGTTLTLGGVMTNTSGANQTTTVNGAGNTLSLGGCNLSNNNTGRTGTFNGTGNVNITGVVANGGSGAGGLTYSGTGTMTLGGQNTFTGNTNVGSGTLVINSTGGLYTVGYTATPVVTISSGSTLQLAAWAYGVDGGLENLDVGATRLVVNGGTITYTGTGEGAGNQNNGRLFTIGSGGATLNAAGTGTWFIEPYAAYDSTIGQVIPSGLTLTLAGSANGRYNKRLSGAGSLTKSDTGTWTIAGANTYTGTTTVSGGTLQVVSPGSLHASSVVTVGTGGTLGGNGTLNGSVTVGSAGSLAPGASVGTLAIGGGLNVSALANGGTGKLNFELDSLASTNDRIAVTGTLSIGVGALGFNDFVFTNLGGLQVTGATPYTLITSGGIAALNTLDAANLSGSLPGGLTGTLQINGNNIELVVTSGNTAPTITDIANPPSFPSGGNTDPLAFTITDEDVNSVTATATSSNPALVPNANIVFSGSGANRTVTITPVPGLSGSATITVTLTDNGNLTTNDTFLLTVTDNYLSWFTLNGVTGGENGDSDNDGTKNLVEYALVDGGERGVLSGYTITYTKRGGIYGSDVTYIIETSETLASGSWTDAVTHGPALLLTNPTISYTFTPGTPLKKFSRLKVVKAP